MSGRLTMSMLAVELEDVRPRFVPDPWKVPLSLRIPVGAFVTMVTSPSRAASLFRLLLAFDEPVTGTLRVLGEEPHGMRRHALRAFRRQVGSSLLPDGLTANITIRANFVLPLIFGDGLSSPAAHERVDEVLDRFGLTSVADRRPPDLSPDTRQVAALARAVVSRPALLLLHDPLTSVNNHEAVRLLKLSREYATSVVAAVHDEDEAVCQMADGAAVWDEQGYRELARA